jgi:Lipoma HMGIC fusion partner-like protein.
MLVLSATFYPRWLISEEKSYLYVKLNKTYEYHETIGVYSKCAFSRNFKNVFCRPYASRLSEVTSIAWQSCLFLLGLSLLILGIASLFAVASFCKQIIRRKSLMNLAGILQTIAGLLLIITF